MKDKIIAIILVIVLVAITTYALSLYFESERKLEASDNAATQIAEGYKFKLSQKDSTLALQKQLIIDKNSKLAKLGDTIQDLKKLQGQVRIKTITKIERDTILMEGVVKTDSGTYLRLPYSLSNESKWFGYRFTLDTTRKAIRDALWFKSDILVAWGTEDHGNFIKNLFKKNNPTIVFKDQNPYSTTTEMQNAIYKDFKPERFKVGLQFGYGITPKGLQPYAGVGVGINIR